MHTVIIKDRSVDFSTKDVTKVEKHWLPSNIWDTMIRLSRTSMTLREISEAVFEREDVIERVILIEESFNGK